VATMRFGEKTAATPERFLGLGHADIAESCSPAEPGRGSGRGPSSRSEEIVNIDGITDIEGITGIAVAEGFAESEDAAASADRAAQARRARFGRLPEQIPYSAMVEETVATPKAVDGYSEERSWLHYSCVALDLAF
jgi:hypothetical protein